MATNGFQNALCPVTFNVTVGTSAVRLKSSSALAVRIQMVSAIANTARLWYGDSNVSSTRGVPIAIGVTAVLDPLKPYDQKTVPYDMANIWMVSTAAAQTAQITYYTEFKNKV